MCGGGERGAEGGADPARDVRVVEVVARRVPEVRRNCPPERSWSVFRPLRNSFSRPERRGVGLPAWRREERQSSTLPMGTRSASTCDTAGRRRCERRSPAEKGRQQAVALTSSGLSQLSQVERCSGVQRCEPGTRSLPTALAQPACLVSLSAEYRYCDNQRSDRALSSTASLASRARACVPRLGVVREIVRDLQVDQGHHAIRCGTARM